MKKIAILGFGKEGASTLKFIKKIPAYRNAKIAILDQKRDPDYLKHLADFDIVFRSPGVAYKRPEIQQALKKGVRFSSVTKLFFERSRGTIIGVTGSKGKGTTCTLLYEILKNSGRDVMLAGNIGRSPLELLPKIKKETLVILELSSFQLQDLEKSPPIAIVLDIFPEHLDQHKSMNEYVTAKTNICAHQEKNHIVFHFGDNALTKKIATRGHGKKIPLRGNPFGLKKNFVMAAAVAAYLGCSLKTIVETIRKFKGLPHRLELVRTINFPPGADRSRTKKLKALRRGRIRLGRKNSKLMFYDDSFCTNPGALAAVIDHFERPGASTIIIAGGQGKGLSYAPIGEAAKKSKNLKLAVLIGEDKERIKKAIGQSVKTVYASTLEDAVKKSYNKAKKLLTIGYSLVAIVLAPGAASFDMFRDYKERGEIFQKIVKKLK